jgi:hypothetical protein
VTWAARTDSGADVGFTHHIPWFVDPEDREPYWTRHHRTLDEAQDDHAEELAAGVGSAGEARPSFPYSAVTEPDFLAPARAGSPGVGGAHSHSQPQEES